ncbi:hypothetical protein V498_04058 [Pseudogymnoascus sp. VKM F-4517 (FW-2822)]|nr:hypothetical protein V498_04058 [Pseudogymnoascus sp. VKM F-4517 (FW-2822)]
MEAPLEVFRSAIAAETGLLPEIVDLNTPFEDLGVDAFTSIAILDIVQQRTGIEFPASLFRNGKHSLYDVQKALDNGTTTNGQSAPVSRQLIVQEAHEECSNRVEEFALEAGVADFWTKVYPDQRRLALAYINEAFARLGCPLDNISPGTAVSIPNGVLPKHKRLMNAIFDILADGGLVKRHGDNDQAIRTSKFIDRAPSKALYEKLVKDYPLHANTHRLLHVTGPRLAECLIGAADPIKLLFGTATSRDLLQEFYTNAPMFVAASKHLTALFRRVISQVAKTGERIEILEVGAGFGGTTKFVLDMLVEAGVPFKYTFTDISPSFFSAAKKRYAGLPIPADAIVYDVLNIENTPLESYHGRFHAVLSTNCIHATKDLTVSSTNVRKLLRPGGFFSLIEFTTRLFWLDLVFGLLDGWWLFEDGREHCLADESFWKTSMKAGGFSDVVWAETLVGGKKPNPQTVRLGREHGCDDEIGDGEEDISAYRGAGRGKEGVGPVGGGGVDDGHQEWGDGGDGCGSEDKDVGADALDEPSREEVCSRTSDDHGKKADGGLNRGEGLHGLEEEGEEELDCVKGPPNDEDGNAQRGENAVAPDRGGDDGFAPETLLTLDVEDKGGDEGRGDAEECDGCRGEEVRRAARKDGKHVGEEPKRGAEEQAADPVNFSAHAAEDGTKGLRLGSMVDGDAEDGDDEDDGGEDGGDVISVSPANLLHKDAADDKPDREPNRLPCSQA